MNVSSPLPTPNSHLLSSDNSPLAQKEPLSQTPTTQAPSPAPHSHVPSAHFCGGVPQDAWTQDLLRDHPEKVAQTLRAMQARRDSKRFTLIQDLCKVLTGEPSEALLNTFTSTRLVLVITDIAADRDIYTMPETEMKTARVLFARL